ncbi:MAG: LamG-like jellyroll fold domain-containing protein [Crocosphaera sp.]
MNNLQFHLKSDSQQNIFDDSDRQLSIDSESFPTVVSDETFGHCLQFDGEENYLQLPSMEDIDYSEGFTVSFWGWYDSFNLWSRIIDLGNGPGITNVALANIEESEQLRFYVQASYVDKENVLELGRWIHLAVTINPKGTPTLYKDGEEIDVVFESIQPQVNLTLNYIGKSNHNEDKLFHGKIAHLRIYNKVVTLAEIRRDMATDKPELALALHLPLNESEAAFADNSRWQHPITVTGASSKPDAIFDNTASFNDTNDVLEITPPLQITGDHSFSFFMQPDNIEGKKSVTAELAEEESGINEEEPGIYLEADGRLTYRYQIPDSETVAYEEFSTQQSLPSHHWSHVTLVKDMSRSTLIWYINGQLDSEMNVQAHRFPETSNLTSFSRSNDSHYKGKLAQFRIHQKALSRDAIDNLLQIDTLAKQKSLGPQLGAFLNDNTAKIESEYGSYAFFLKSFDFTDADVSETLNLDLSIEDLKTVQRLVRLTDGIASFSLLAAINLLDSGMASAIQISEMSAAQFVQSYSGAFIPNQYSAETQAKSVFQEALARRSKALLTYIALVQHTEPHYGSSRVNNLRSPTRAAATDRLPSSQKILGNQ